MERLCWAFLWDISSKTTKRTSLSSKDMEKIVIHQDHKTVTTSRHSQGDKGNKAAESLVLPTSAALLNKCLALFKPLEQHRCVTEHVLASRHRKQRCIDESIHLFMDRSLLLLSLFKCCHVSSSTVTWKWHKKKPSTCKAQLSWHHLLIRASKLGSGRSDLLDTSFLRQVGHSLLLRRQQTASVPLPHEQQVIMHNV